MQPCQPGLEFYGGHCDQINQPYRTCGGVCVVSYVWGRMHGTVCVVPYMLVTYVWCRKCGGGDRIRLTEPYLDLKGGVPRTGRPLRRHAGGARVSGRLSGFYRLIEDILHSNILYLKSGLFKLKLSKLSFHHNDHKSHTYPYQLHNHRIDKCLKETLNQNAPF